jgi:hypothetical protein
MGDGQLIAWLKKAHESSTMTTSVCSGALSKDLDPNYATALPFWWSFGGSMKREPRPRAAHQGHTLEGQR